MALDLGGIMHKMNPCVLREVLDQFDGRPELWERLIAKDVAEHAKIDCDGIAKILKDNGIPNDLVEALTLIQGLGSKVGWELLEKRADKDGVKLPPQSSRRSSHDSVARFLMDGGDEAHKFLERVASLKAANMRVAYAYFPHKKGITQKCSGVPADKIEQARQAVVAHLVASAVIDIAQEKAVRIFDFVRENETLFLIRFPGKLNREVGCDPKGLWNSYVFNPAQYDTVIYDPGYNALKMNTHTNHARAREWYRKIFSNMLLDTDFAFARDRSSITMGDIGKKKLAAIFNTAGVPGLTSIRLESISYVEPGTPEVETQFKVRDRQNLLKSMKVSVLDPPEINTRQIQVRRFTVRYHQRDVYEARQLTVSEGDTVNYPRIGETGVIEAWLRKQGFIKEEAVGSD